MMKAIVLEQPGHLALADVARPAEPSADEALVRVRRVGVCGTDFHAFRGRQPYFTYPRILGHELAVEVVAVGANNEHQIAPGDQCAVEPYLNCGRCIACRRGRPNCCVEMKVLGVHVDGGMREMTTVPLGKLHRSPTLSPDQLALVEPLSIGAHAVTRGQPGAEEFVLVIGVGPIGLAVLQFTVVTGAQVIVMDVSLDRLDFCRQYFKVAATVQADETALDEVRRLTGGEMPTLVFDATGSPDSMRQAFNYVAHGGRLVFVGLIQEDVTFSDPDFHRREMTLLGSRNATGADFVRVISLLESGEIDVSAWITHCASAGEMIERFPLWLEARTGYIKGLIEF